MKVHELITELQKLNSQLPVEIMTELCVKRCQIQDVIKEVAHTDKYVILIGTERDMEGNVECNT